LADSKRIDPPSRPVDGAVTDAIQIGNQDPTRVYCLANPNDFYCGVPEMQRLGWEIERSRKDGPRIFGGEASKDGEVVTVLGQVLMSRSRAKQAEYEARKAAVADMRSKSIGARGGVDGIVGPTGQVAQFSQSPEETIERVRS
jgi:hypothetical protein